MKLFLNLIKSFKQFIKDYKKYKIDSKTLQRYKQEKETEEYYMVKAILLASDINDDLLIKIGVYLNKVKELEKEFKEESEKDYSERKYEIGDEAKTIWKKYKDVYDKYIHGMYDTYYTYTGNDLLEDVERCLIYLEKSELYKNAINTKTMMKELKRIFSEADVTQEMNKITTYFK